MAFVRYATSETMDAIEQLPDQLREKVCNQTNWPVGPRDEDDYFCFATLRHEADALAAESSTYLESKSVWLAGQ